MSNFAMTAILIACVGLLVVIFAAYFDRIKLSLHSMKPLTVIIIVIILIGAIVFLCFSLFGPRGEGSIFSANKEAESTGNDDFNEESLLNQCFSDATAGNAEGDMAVYIKVSGDKVTVGQKVFSDLDDLKSFLGILVRTDAAYILVDDYASARTYESVVKVLESVGIQYIETAE